MRSLLQLLMAATCALTGCQRPSLSASNLPPPDPQLNKLLADLFSAHGAAAKQYGDWVEVDGGRLRCRAATVAVNRYETGLSVQLDVAAQVPDGKIVLESFGGLGADEPSAVKNACENFANSSFHVLLSALLDRPCEHVDTEEWIIGESSRRVTLGSITGRANVRPEEPTSADWFPVMEKKIKGSRLSPGLHWIRIFHSEVDGKSPTTEVLLDNDIWSSMQEEAEKIEWPKREGFYSVRIFVIVQDNEADEARR